VKKQLYLKQALHASVLVTALQKHGAALDASSTGCGKTVIAAEITAQFRPPTLVVCLKNSIPMWQAEMKERGWPAIGVINYEMLRRGKTPWGKWVGPTKIFQWTLPKDTLIIWDEVQRCQGMNSQNSKMLIAAKPFWNLMLSATAVENPSEMKALGYILGLHNLRGFWGWCKLRGCEPNQWGGLDFVDLDGKYMQMLHQEIFPEHGSRLTVADLADHFTETQIITTPVEFGSEIEKIYEAMEAEIAELEEIMTTDSKHPAAERLVAQLRARQKVELCKVPVIIEMTEDLLREGRSVVVFVNFDATIEALSERLKDHVIIRGGQTSVARTAAMDAFQSNTCRLLLCNVQAGGTSINLHDVHGSHPRTSIVSPSWNAKDILQALGRIHRAGGATPTQQHVLFAAGTVEAKVEKVLREKMKNIDIFNDGKKTIDQPNDMIQTDEPVETKTAPPTPEPAHAQFNPSSLSLFEKCPGFLNRTGTNEAAERGTRIHNALEKDEFHTLVENERHLAQICKDYVESLIEERKPALPDYDYREIRMKMDLGNDITTFGTCDRLLIYGGHGIMIDYKSGYRLVADAEVNAQAWAYVIGAFQKFPLLQTIEFLFLIPNRDEVTFHTFSRDDMAAMILRLNTIIRRAMEADPKLFNPGPELCEYCARQGSCPALAQKALSAAAQLADGLPLPTSMLVSGDRPDDVPKILRLAPIFADWAETAKKEALRLNLEEGLEFEGFERRERKNPRGITSVVGAWDVAKEHGISLTDFLLACRTVSVPDLEDLAAASVKRGSKGKPGKQAARQKFENELRSRDLLRDESKYFYLQEKKK
jgi:superfamily II DNA or RNA helicase